MSEEEPELELPVISRKRLTNAQLHAVISHINRKSVSQTDACLVCGSSNNSVASDVYRLVVASNPSIANAPFQPLYSTICNDCGFVRFFNKLITDGLIDTHERSRGAETENG